jgi:hypothetical protein
MTLKPLESDGRAAASKAERAGSIPARGTHRRTAQRGIGVECMAFGVPRSRPRVS